MEWVLLVLVALAIPVLGVIGFFMGLGTRKQTQVLEERIVGLEAQLAAALFAGGFGQGSKAADEVSAPAQPEASTEASANDTAPDEEIAPELPPDEGMDSAPVIEPALAPALPRPSLEERIGTRWAVWAGGIALGLGGVFLVRFAVDQGFFGPGARIVAGAVFALALLAGGEWMRRRDQTAPLIPAFGALPPASIPAVLTAAGTLAAFGTAYAAHALYGMIGPAVAFVLLGAIALATLAAAALHGPAVAAVGIVAAFGAPLLVASAKPSPWPVILYIAVVAAAGYGLARIRVWLWLAIATLAGVGFWSFALAESFHGQAAELIVHFGIQTVLAAFFLALDPHRGEPDETAEPDVIALAALGVLSLLATYALQAGGFGMGRPVLGWVMLALVWAVALRVPATAIAGLFGAGVALATLFAWPVAREAAGETVTVLPGPVSSGPMPDALWLFLLFAATSGGALAAGALVRLVRTPLLRWTAAGAYAATGAVGPIALLVMTWWRVSDFDRSIPFAMVAAAMAAAYTAAATLFLRIEANAHPVTPDSSAETDESVAEPAAVRSWLSATFGVEASAAAALAALAAGLTMVLDKGALTVALALTAAGAAWITTRRPVGTLRYAIGVVGVAVLARLAWDPQIMSGDLGSTPILNWLLWGYGVPAAAFAAASVLLRRQKDDQVVALCEALAVVFTGMLLAFEIRHALNGALDGREPGHLEAGLQVFVSLMLATALVQLEAVRRSAVLRIASYLLGGVGLIGALASLFAFANPLFTNSELIAGGAVLNTLLPAYLLPAGAAILLARMARGRRPRWFVLAAFGLGFALHFLWLVLEVRHIFQGAAVEFDQRTSPAEVYAYSAAFLVTGLLLLAWGIWRGSAPARLASGLYILLTVAKVFLIDMAGLEGAWRALSFIGLGLALVGIGLVYQKLVFSRPAAAAPPTPEPDAPPA